MNVTARSTLADVAALVAAALERAGFRAVLTGGACATVYSAGVYQSFDLDFILQEGRGQSALDGAMAGLGFARDHDRYIHPRTRFFVEFPRGPLAIGNDIDIRPVRLALSRGATLALSATDACRDRLAAFYHWSDRQSLDAAVAIARRHRVNMRLIREWSARENAGSEFEEFRLAVRSKR